MLASHLSQKDLHIRNEIQSPHIFVLMIWLFLPKIGDRKVKNHFLIEMSDTLSSMYGDSISFHFLRIVSIYGMCFKWKYEVVMHMIKYDAHYHSIDEILFLLWNILAGNIGLGAMKRINMCLCVFVIENNDMVVLKFGYIWNIP